MLVDYFFQISQILNLNIKPKLETCRESFLISFELLKNTLTASFKVLQEAVAQKNTFPEISQNSHENTCVRDSGTGVFL